MVQRWCSGGAAVHSPGASQLPQRDLLEDSHRPGDIGVCDFLTRYQVSENAIEFCAHVIEHTCGLKLEEERLLPTVTHPGLML